MIHHDKRDYQTAVSEAATHFQKKIEDMIHASTQRVTQVIEQVESDVPEDMLAVGKKLQFTNSENGIALVPPATADVNPGALQIHDHAFGQICEKAKVRNLGTVLRELRGRGEWGRKLAADNLNEIYSHFNGDRFLLRAVRGQLRGFLSDSYRRLDSRPLLDAFVQAIQRYGARPVDGFALTTKINLRALLPMIFEPFPGEIMAFGIQLSDSDYGDGTLNVAGFLLRCWCTNLATTEDVLSQVHLGRKLSDVVEFSRRTLELDTQTMASAVSDVAGHVLAPKAINRYIDLVKRANEEKIETGSIHAWAKKNLTKTETDSAVNKFASADIELLPAGQTKWRWSNALSWLANETQDEHRKLELQDFAGGILK